MKIKLLDYKVVALNMSAAGDIASPDGSMSLEVGQVYPDDESGIFGIGFKVDLKQDNLSVEAEMRFFFQADGEITDEFRRGPFPAINAPAIAFPYLRSFLSTVTLQAGYEPVMLPSVNFVEFARRAAK